MQDTYGQYWGNEMYGLGCNVLHWSYCKERQCFVIAFIENTRKWLYLL